MWWKVLIEEQKPGTVKCIQNSCHFHSPTKNLMNDLVLFQPCRNQLRTLPKLTTSVAKDLGFLFLLIVHSLCLSSESQSLFPGHHDTSVLLLSWCDFLQKNCCKVWKCMVLYKTIILFILKKYSKIMSQKATHLFLYLTTSIKFTSLRQFMLEM